MPAKQKSYAREIEKLFGGPAAQIPMLSSSEVTEILGIKMWRLERFLENYPLKAGQPGQGQGTRRLFSPDDVRRVFIAKWLLDDGYQPKLVAEIMEDFSDSHFVEYDKEGAEIFPVLLLLRDPKTHERRFEIQFLRPEGVTIGDAGYYRLDFATLAAEVDEQIKTALQKRGKV